MIILSYIYHFVITLVLFNSLSTYSYQKYDNHKFYFFRDYLSSIDNPQHIILGLLFLSLVFNLLIFVVNNSKSRFFAQLFSLLYFLSLFSSIKIQHSNHAIIYVILSFCFFNYKTNLSDSYNRLVLRSGQASLLSIYFCSGLWKVRMYLGSNDIHDFYTQVLNQYAYSVAEGGHSFFTNVNPITISQLFFSGYIFVIIFQISSIGMILFPRWIRYYGIIVVLFHMSTGVLMDIWFTNTMIAAFLLFSLTDILFDREKHLNEKVLT